MTHSLLAVNPYAIWTCIHSAATDSPSFGGIAGTAKHNTTLLVLALQVTCAARKHQGFAHTAHHPMQPANTNPQPILHHPTQQAHRGLGLLALKSTDNTNTPLSCTLHNNTQCHRALLAGETNTQACSSTGNHQGPDCTPLNPAELRRKPKKRIQPGRCPPSAAAAAPAAPWGATSIWLPQVRNRGC